MKHLNKSVVCRKRKMPTFHSVDWAGDFEHLIKKKKKMFLPNVRIGSLQGSPYTFEGV